MVKLKPSSSPAGVNPTPQPEQSPAETSVVYHEGKYSRSVLADIRHDDRLKKWVGYAGIEASFPSASNAEEPHSDEEVGLVSENSRHQLIDSGRRWCLDAWNRQIKKIDDANWDSSNLWPTGIVDAARFLYFEVPPEIRGMCDEYAMYSEEAPAQPEAAESAAVAAVEVEQQGGGEPQAILAAAEVVGRVAIERSRAKLKLASARSEYDAANSRLEEALDSLTSAVERADAVTVEQTAETVGNAIASAEQSEFADGSIDALNLPKGLKQILLDAGLRTVSDIGAWTASGKKLTEIPKVGQSKADRLAEALEAFWKNA